MDEKIFRQFCENKLKEFNLNDELHKNRLNEELKEIFAKDEISYFISLAEKKEIYENEHNLLVPFLLGIVKEFSINQPYKFDIGDAPDIDLDYVPDIRDYLKNEYCPKAFNEDKVCNICTYTKFGIRSALIDMARVLGIDRKEVMALTKALKVKDDEGDVLTWDKALELYDDLREYLEKHPELAESAKKLLNRIRGMGVHASGLIISNVNIKEFVPLVMPRGKNINPSSAWVEGLSGSDLGAVGLVKFDFLGLDATEKIGRACHYAKKLFKEARKEYLETGKLPINEYFRSQIDNEELAISALPGQKDFSDLSYLNDPKSLAMGNTGKLKMVFQFDGSPGIRSLAKQGGVRKFEDLPALASLYRPGPMKCLSKDSLIMTETAEIPLSEVNSSSNKIAYVTKDSELKFTSNFIVQKSEKKKCLKIRTKSGKEIITSKDHVFFLENNQTKKANQLFIGEKIISLN